VVEEHEGNVEKKQDEEEHEKNAEDN